MREIRLIFFRVGEFEAALPAAQVEAVVSDVPAGSQVAVAGRPLHVMDGRQVFRLPPRQEAGRVLVVRRGEHRFGLRIDTLEGLRSAEEADFRPLPPMLERLRPTPALVAVVVAPEPIFVLDAWRLPGALATSGRVGLPVKDAP